MSTKLKLTIEISEGKTKVKKSLKKKKVFIGTCDFPSCKQKSEDGYQRCHSHRTYEKIQCECVTKSGKRCKNTCFVYEKYCHLHSENLSIKNTKENNVKNAKEERKFLNLFPASPPVHKNPLDNLFD